MNNIVEVPVKLEFCIDEASLIREAEEKAAKSLVNLVIQDMDRPYYRDSILQPLWSLITEEYINRILNSEDAVLRIALEVAKRVTLNKKFVTAVTQATASSETGLLTPDDFDDTTDVDLLPFSVRARNALVRNGVKTIGDIKKLTLVDLMKIRNLGSSTIDEIVKTMRGIGVTFKYSNEDDMTQEDGDAEVD